jgi:hypothetical protein
MIYPKRLRQLSGLTGKVQAPLKGHERIFSRNDTAKIIGMAKKALSREHLIQLGQYMVETFNRQDMQKPEFTS